ncbi:MAG: lactate utilization protein [Chloroflexi bacterium]|nr:lactate utilization protein [Chloroflexota bacterium]
MITEVKPGLDPSISRRFGTLASEPSVERAAAALEGHGITVIRAKDAAEAKRVVLGLIPDGSQVNHGASATLDATGITDELDKSGRYDALRPQVWGMDRATQADQIRRLSAAPDVMLGSVQAITETGSLIAASSTGSQVGPYASGGGKVILVAGTQKIVPDLDEGLRRIDEYAFPLEDVRAQAAYGVHSGINKVLIINREIQPGRITVVLVDEVLGF